MVETVLVVEDDHDIRVTLRVALEAMGVIVLSAADGAEGLELLKHTSPCVILLDQSMPRMSGREFLEIKNRDPKLAAIPVIVMSAVENHLEEVGTSEFIKKPFDLQELMEVVSKYRCSKMAKKNLEKTIG